MEHIAKPKPLPFRKLSSIDIPSNGGGCSFGLIGSTRSGKSTAMLYLWEKYFKDQTTVLMTGSATAEIYKPLAKTAAICPEFHSELIKEAIKMNQDGPKPGCYPTTFIFDDMLDGKNSKALQKLLCIGRNSNLSTIYVGQELSILNSIGRTNLNFLLLFRLNSDMAIEKVVRNYLRHVLPRASIADQCAMYKELTTDHHFICVDCLANEVFLSKLDV